MVRKINKGIIFYPMEANHTSNKRIRLLFNDHDSDGYWIWSNIISYGYRQHGYYFHANTEDIELMASDCRKSPELIEQVILSCVKRGLFDKEIYEQYSVLTNDRMQVNYLRATYENRRKGSIVYFSQKYFAIGPDELGEFSDKFLENAIIKESGELLKNVAKKNTLFPENNQSSAELHSRSAESQPASTEKRRNSEHKGKERKVKDSKVNTLPADAVSVNGHHGIKKTSDPGYGDGVKKVGGKRKKVAPKKEKTPDVILFNRMKELWMAWFFTRSKKPGKFEAKEAASLSKLRAYFLRVSKDEADPYESAYGEFKFILDNWEKLKSNKFLYSCVDISMMLSKINDITNFLNHEEAKGGDPTGGVGRTITFDKA